MDDSDLLNFDPVPVRSRRDGWTPERQRTFIDWLSKGLRPGRAAARGPVPQNPRSVCRLVGLHDGLRDAPALGDLVAVLSRPTEWQRAVEGVLRPVRYRGRIVAYDRRFDDVAMLRLLGRLTKLIENRGNAGGQ